MTYQEKLDLINRVIFGKTDWLKKVEARKLTHPDHEVDRYKRDVAGLKAIAEDYERAIARAA